LIEHAQEDLILLFVEIQLRYQQVERFLIKLRQINVWNSLASFDDLEVLGF